MSCISSALLFPFPVVNEERIVTLGREVMSYKSRGGSSEETDIQMVRETRVIQPTYYCQEVLITSLSETFVESNVNRIR